MLHHNLAFADWSEGELRELFQVLFREELGEDIAWHPEDEEPEAMFEQFDTFMQLSSKGNISDR